MVAFWGVGGGEGQEMGGSVRLKSQPECSAQPQAMLAMGWAGWGEALGAVGL